MKIVAFAFAVLVAAGSTFAQRVESPDPHVAANLIIPQSRAYVTRGGQVAVRIAGVEADVKIAGQLATTSLEIKLENTTGAPQEAEMVVPLPDGATLRAFGFDGAGVEPTAKLLPKAEARAIYRAIVSKLRDPALLEFAGYNLVRSSVFPIPPNRSQTVRITYEHLLRSDGTRLDYELPRSESFDTASTPWRIKVDVDAERAIATVYSPSHEIVTAKRGFDRVEVTAAGEQGIAPGPFRLSVLVENAGLSGSVIAYPDPSVGGGYFLLLAGAPPAPAGRAAAIKREVTLVVDRSGSMEGEKFEQARAAALQVLEGLREGEAFNIVDYSDTVASFAERPVVKTARSADDARAYVRRLAANGGTNIRDALLTALEPAPSAGMLPIVLFLTDGLPTVGERSEVRIRDAVRKANTHKRRVFTFGVGYDVNVPLLTNLATVTRATTTFVLPRENVEAKVSQTFARLSGPVLASPRFEVLGASGAASSRAVREVLPAELGDVFDGDQIVVLGQYTGDGKIAFRVDGETPAGRRTFTFDFDPASASARNAYVPRLWASRKIARLVDEIAQAGAEGAEPLSEAQMKELVGEIVRLSIQFGILTEYTAFLATEGTDLSAGESITTQAGEELVVRAQRERSGVAAVNQGVNVQSQAGQRTLSRANAYYDRDMNRVETTSVQQIQDRTFFRRNNRWIDARLVERTKTVEPERTVVFGTAEFDSLVDQLVAEGRQGILALTGEILLSVDGRPVLVTVSK